MCSSAAAAGAAKPRVHHRWSGWYASTPLIPSEASFFDSYECRAQVVGESALAGATCSAASLHIGGSRVLCALLE